MGSYGDFYFTAILKYNMCVCVCMLHLKKAHLPNLAHSAALKVKIYFAVAQIHLLFFEAFSGHVRQIPTLMRNK
jgi:hypothetical protein